MSTAMGPKMGMQTKKAHINADVNDFMNSPAVITPLLGQQPSHADGYQCGKDG